MSDIDPDPGFNSKTARIQVAWGIWVNMSNIVIGLAYGFPVGQMPQITGPGSNIAVSFVEELWIDNVLVLICPLGCLFSGHVMDEYGRRISLLISQVPMCLGWLCISSAQSVLMLIIGRAITGIACGMAMAIPTLYTSEVSLPNMRGLLGAFPLIFLYFGIIIQVGLGSIVAWQKMCFIYFAMNAFLFFSYLLLANSPQFLLMRNIHDAIHAVTYFRATGYKIDREQNRLIEFKQENNIRRLTLKEQRYVLFLRAVCKPFTIVMTYMAFACLFGLPVTSVWTINVFLFTDASYNVQVGYILIALTGFVSSFLTAWLLYHIDRRNIAIFSGLGVAGTCVILGLFLQAGSGQTLAPQLLLMLYTVFVTMGFQCLPFLLMTEVYLIEVRGILISVSLTIFNLMSFAVMQSFPYLNIIFGIPGISFILGAYALLAVLVLYLYLPDTRRLTLQEIEEYYRGRRPALISDREISEARVGKRTIKPEIAAMFGLGRSSDTHHLHSKSFVEASGSMISICSKRSVVLHIGDKHYINEEWKHEIEDLHETQHQTSLDKHFFGHRDSVTNTDEDGTSHKSKHTR